MAVRQILLDTNAYAAFKRNLPEAVELIRRAPLIGINTIVLGELLAGGRQAPQEDRHVGGDQAVDDAPVLGALGLERVVGLQARQEITGDFSPNPARDNVPGRHG